MPDEPTTATLTQREEEFCLLVLAGKIPSLAYKLAYEPKKAKAKTIHEMSSRLMKQRKIRARLEELRKPAVDDAIMQRDEWLRSLTMLARADVRKMFDNHGNPIEIVDLPNNEAHAVSAFEFCEEFAGKGEARIAVGFTKKFKLTDRPRVLELIGKAQSFYIEKREITGADGKPLSLTVEFIDSNEAADE